MNEKKEWRGFVRFCLPEVEDVPLRRARSILVSVGRSVNESKQSSAGWNEVHVGTGSSFRSADFGAAVSMQSIDRAAILAVT